MCPSYMVTREEKHSTRGRARLLFEMLRGDVVTDGWRDEEVRDALDLCLSCKGCKERLPRNVDMATYKAEFLSHYYQRPAAPTARLRLGLIHLVGAARRRGAAAGQLVTADAPFSAAGQGGRRHRAASGRCRSSRRRRSRLVPAARRRSAGRAPVVLWPDTFTNHFHPSRPWRRSRCWRRPGSQVVVPRRRLCCGRPLYDYGMLDLARALPAAR